MPKRIEPLSSRAHIVDQGPSKTARPKDAANGTLQQPRRMEQPKRSSSASKPPQKKWTLWRKIVLVAQIGFILAVIVAAVAGYFIYEKALVYYARAETYDLKKLDDLNVTSTFLDINGEELGRIFVEDRIVLKPEEIPNTMRQAVMAAEDKRFYEHGAIDYWGIVRALHQDLMHKSHGVQGGSTIEQQLAKHLIGDFSRTLDRKFLEAFVAIRLEQNLSKDQIMNYYLNRIYFGKGYFGVGAAARGYFGKDASQLTVPECALLAGIIRAPVTSSPRTDPQKAKMRRDTTLKTMYEVGDISREDYIRDIQTPVRVLPPKPDGRQTYVMVAAVKELEQILSVEGTEEMPQGLTVRTNIDLRLQRALESTMNEHLSALESAQPAGPPNLAAPKPVLQGAAIVVDVPTGRVQAWIGGRDFNKNQYDHISMAKRESGALLQPLLYGLAFDRLNLTPASMINASYIDPSAPPAQQDLGLGNPQTDLNKWFLSVEDALALGNKSAATRVGLKIEASNVNDWFHKAGIEQGNVPTNKPHVFNPDPMTLGDIASIYQILGNGGEKRKLKLIRSITAMNGKAMYEDGQPDHNDGRDAMLNNINDQQLTLTLQNSLREGPARTLTRDYGFHSAMAGMPGYSEGYRDAWFVGFTPQTLAGVWVGYDDSRAIGPKELAVKSAVPLWGDVMRQIQARQQMGTTFPVPSELTKVEIDRSTGALRGLAGLAPAPSDIFVYLKKDQVDAAGNTTASATMAPPEWSDWLTTMFNQADETGLTGDQIMGGGDKRSNIIPALAEYKMPGLRGDILSSDGTVYATTASEKNLVLGWPGTDQATADTDIVKWMRTRLNEVQQTIGTTLNISDADLLNQYKMQRYQPLMVVENLTPDQVDKIQAAGMEAKGFGFQTAPLRVYPKGPQLAHVLGYLARDQQRNKGKYLGGDVIYDRYKGASGLEEVYNKDLGGKDGRFMISTTPDGYARSAAVADAATYGNNVRMSIDSKVQTALETAMAQSTNPMKAGVIMNVQTGDVVAMASHPTYDPNVFVPSIDADMWNALNTAQYNPLLDRTLHAQYPPGSQFKTVTSIAAMRAGVFDPNWVVHCTGSFDLGSMHMDLKNERGDVTYLEALTHSYNTYFATLGLKIGRDVLIDTARSFNFGNPTHINLPGELPGFIPDEESVKRMHQRDFGVAGGDTALTAIGQGDVLVTPLQMADFMAALGNGGTVYKPRLVKDIEDRNGNVVQNFPTDTISTVQFDDKWMPALKEAMINVIDEGTATVVHRDDIKIAAKTGTAQVGSKTKRRQIAWLSGYWPADNPQYSFSVMVEGRFEDNKNDTEEGGLLGGRECGQIVHDMLEILYPTPGKHKKDKDDEVANDDDSSKTKHPGEDKSANEDPGQASTASTDDTPATNAAPVAPLSPIAPGDTAIPAPAPAPAPQPVAPPAAGNTAGANATQ